MKKWIILIGAACLLSACASYHATVTKKRGSIYHVVSTSARQGDAMRGARNEAISFCEQQGKSMAVLNYNTNFNGRYDQMTHCALNYHGADAKSVMNASTKVNRTGHDFSTVINFRCVVPHQGKPCGLNCDSHKKAKKSAHSRSKYRSYRGK